MANYITRIAGLMLAFGFFFGCSTLFKSKSNTPLSSEQYSEKQLQKKIISINEKIGTKPKSADLLFKKGFYLTELAQKKERPDKRTPLYFQAQQSLHKASDLYNTSSGNEKKEKIHQLLKVNWSNEHNQGVQIIQRDSSLKDADYIRAATHFKNATVIIPDSSISYEMEAQAYYKNRQPDQGITVLESARSNIKEPPASLLEQLGFLYTESNQLSKAIDVYEEAEVSAHQNLNLLHGLANAYMSAGKHQKAVESLQLLVKNKPANIIYRQSLATELYNVAGQKVMSIKSQLKQGTDLSNTEYATADTLMKKAEDQFSHIMSTTSADEDTKQQFAYFYQNWAAKLQQLLPHIHQNAEESIEKDISHYLSASVPLLEQISKENPDDQQISQHLYQAYSYLGREKEARSIKEKANI